MKDWARISFACEDIAEWFDWNRHRVVTSPELAAELDLSEADVQTVFSELVLAGKIEQHALGYHRAVRRTANQVWNPPAFQVLAIPFKSTGAMAHVSTTKRQEKLA
jgi:hypothetical protein